MFVRRPMMSVSQLSCVGSRCITTTKAMPLSAGIAAKNSSKASTPPADAPMPTTGKFAAIARLR
jgi:hypothetical protein